MLFDAAVVEAIVEGIPTWFAIVLLFLSYLGSIYVIGPAVVAGYLFGNRSKTVTWIPIVIGGYGLFVALKPLFSIPRPDVGAPFARETLPTLLYPLYDFALSFSTGGFPSGHAVAMTVICGLFVLDIERGTVKGRIVAMTTLLGSVGFSRVALGTHYIGDILGGILIGLLWLGGTVAIRRRFQRPVFPLLGVAILPGIPAFLLGRPDDALILVGAVALVAIIYRLHYQEQGIHRPNRTP